MTVEFFDANNQSTRTIGKNHLTMNNFKRNEKYARVNGGAIIQSNTFSTAEYDNKIREMRRKDYQEESDELFFQSERTNEGVTGSQWRAKVQEIKQRHRKAP